jgi:CRP/FNR family transcriptional regulator, anaerobic regulatory protein
MRNPNGNQTSTLFSREDMGAMMDLKPETISREITKLVREKVIEPMDKVGRNYKVLQPSHLQPE